LGFEPVNLDGGYHLWSNSPANNDSELEKTGK
ncbi:MAG: hypothetical protein RLZZ17_990, partial [Actinomycetota bacterium]